MSLTEDRTPHGAARGALVHPIVQLGTAPGSARRFGRDLGDLARIPWEEGTSGTSAEPAAVDDWVSAAAAVLTEGDSAGAHVLVTGQAAHAAIVLAARHPELVVSLLLGDPEVDVPPADYAEQLAAVRAPTLVVASAPDAGHVGESAQRIAGGVPGGVFVVIDGARVPAHRERSGSFNEWAVTFTEIAEGLAGLTADDS